MTLDEIDTLNDLKLWLSENMPGSTVSEGAGGIVINTGLASSMGGYLSPIEGKCDRCASSYELNDKDNRCGNCGNCSGCCTHEREGEIHKCAVCDSDKVNEKPKIKDSFHGLQYLCDDDEKGCWDSYEGWYCDTCLLLHDHGTTMESDNSCQKESE